MWVDIPSGEDKTPKDHLYESIIDSDPTSNLATSLPGLSTIITASEPKYALNLVIQLIDTPY